MALSINNFIEDSAVIDALADEQTRLIMIIGGSDTGKTTLIESIADFLSARTDVGIVDLDMGQSHIGLPSTIAWGKLTGGFKNWDHISVEDFYFAGTITPFGSLVSAVVGAKLITDRAAASVGKVIVDTSGLIAEDVGRVLKQNKIDILRPDMVLALERSGELGHILDVFRFHDIPRIHRLRVPMQIKAKSFAKRSGHRLSKVKAYFAHSEIIEISIGDVGLRFTGEQLSLDPAILRNRLVSFRDKMNIDFDLGVIEGIKQAENKLLIRTPSQRAAICASIVIGKTELDMTTYILKDRH